MIKIVRNVFFMIALQKALISDDEIHVIGNSIAQEKFIKYLSETPQYKIVEAFESTSNKMIDEKLTEYISSNFI